MNFFTLFAALLGPHLKQIVHIKPHQLKGLPGVTDDAHAAQLAGLLNLITSSQIDAHVGQVMPPNPENLLTPTAAPQQLGVPAGTPLSMSLPIPLSMPPTNTLQDASA